MKHLLMLTHHFPPSGASGAFRMSGFAKHLPACGWKVTVVACPHVPLEPLDETRVFEPGEHVSVEYVDFPRTLRVRAKGRLHRFSARAEFLHITSEWCRSAAPVARRVLKAARPDAILTSGPPHSIHLLGRQLAREFSTRWIADFRDPWYAGGPNRPWPGNLLARRNEQRVFAAADAIIANAPNATQELQRAYPQYSDRFHTITNGIDADPMAPAPPATEAVELLHAGEIYCGRNPAGLLEAIHDLNASPGDRAPIRMTFVGRDPQQQVAAGVDRFEVGPFVTNSGQVTHAEVLRLFERTQILVVIDQPGRKLGIPAKLFEYMGSGRAILGLVDRDGDSSWALQQHSSPCRVADPSSPGEIRQAIEELAVEISQGRPFEPCRQFARSELTRKLAAVLNGSDESAADTPHCDDGVGAEPPSGPRQVLVP